jgi:TetR/AcrR family transcriptional repressor of mexJK operon
MGRAETRLAILKAGLELFSERGFSASKTRDIAAEAGVSEMTLFRHFPTKMQLFEAVFATFVFNPGFEKIGSELTGDLERDLDKLSERFITLMRNNRELLKMSFRDMPELVGDRDPLAKYPNALKDVIAEYLRRHHDDGIIEGDPETHAMVFLSSLYGVAMNVLIFKRFETGVSLEACRRALVQLFVKGLISGQKPASKG